MPQIEDYYQEFECYHIGIVSISETECQCMDCLRVWLKGSDFKSDWPNQDRESSTCPKGQSKELIEKRSQRQCEA